MNLTKVQEINMNQKSTTIPKEISEELELKKGDRIVWETGRVGVTLKKLEVK